MYLRYVSLMCYRVIKVLTSEQYIGLHIAHRSHLNVML